MWELHKEMGCVYHCLLDTAESLTRKYATLCIETWKTERRVQVQRKKKEKKAVRSTATARLPVFKPDAGHRGELRYRPHYTSIFHFNSVCARGAIRLR